MARLRPGSSVPCSGNVLGPLVAHEPVEGVERGPAGRLEVRIGPGDPDPRLVPLAQDDPHRRVGHPALRAHGHELGGQREPEGRERVESGGRRAEIYQRLGIPTVATVTWTIDQVRRRLLPDKDVGDWSDATGRLTLIDRSLPEDWAGRPLSEIEQPGHLSLVSVTRAGVPRLDGRQLIGQEGDVLHIAVLDDALRQFDELLARTSGRAQDAGK